MSRTVVFTCESCGSTAPGASKDSLRLPNGWMDVQVYFGPRETEAEVCSASCGRAVLAKFAASVADVETMEIVE